MTTFELEIGRLMAQFESLKNDIDDLKKGMEATNKQLVCLHSNFATFSSELMSQMEKRFILRREVAPLRAVLSVMVLTTLSAICLGFGELIFKKLF